MGADPFTDLKKLNNQEFLTFQEACEPRGLLENVINLRWHPNKSWKLSDNYYWKVLFDVGVSRSQKNDEISNDLIRRIDDYTVYSKRDRNFFN